MCKQSIVARNWRQENKCVSNSFYPVLLKGDAFISDIFLTFAMMTGLRHKVWNSTKNKMKIPSVVCL